MQRAEKGLIYSPSDLIRFFQSDFITWMDRYHLERPGEVQPDEADEESKLVQAMGDEHEKQFVAELEAAGHAVLDLTGSANAVERTLQAMRRGERVIYQGKLELPPFAGFPDFLFRVDEPSQDTAWSYEVWDAKLARNPKPYFLLQLCCYAEMLEAVQGRRPRFVRVVLGKHADGKAVRESYRTDDFFYFYREVKQAFLAQQALFDADRFPEIPAMADLGRWTGYAERLLEARDDLSLVANIRRSQVQKLQAAGIGTMTQLAHSSGARVPRLGRDSVDRLQQQAALQVASKDKARPEYLILPAPENPQVGLASLPPPSKHDIFFDMEGFPLVDEGREYLFGAYAGDEDGFHFYDWWAHSPEQEKAALVLFVKWAYGRWQADPSLHIYHYNHYEVTALTRLAGRYGVCEEEVDDLLRNHVFVDLFRIVRQALLIGEPSYSLKYVEHLYRGRREGDVASAGESMVVYQRWLAAPDGDTHESSKLLRQIRDYNEQDCLSTSELAVWLRLRQEEAGILYKEPAAPPPPKEREDRLRIHALSAEIVSATRAEESEQDRRMRELLGQILEFHWRNEKPVWRQRFEWGRAEETELMEDPECLAGLVRTPAAPRRVKKSFEYEFRFPTEQETKLRQGKDCLFAHDWKRGAEITELDFESGVIRLKTTMTSSDVPARLSLLPDEPTLRKLIEPAVERVVMRWWQGGGLPQALGDFLCRRRPRLRGCDNGPIVSQAGEVDSVFHAVTAMQNTCLCIQGPPGSGKTFMAAHVIEKLLLAGKRVAVLSNAHKAINLVLSEVEKLTRGSRGVSIAKIGDNGEAEGLPDAITRYANGNAFFKSGYESLVGGTAFAFCHADAGAPQNRFDYLFVDEASQVAVANLVAVSECANNIVLLGDQMQLGQPAQGSHPGESGYSTLEYLLDGKATIPDDFGIFLPKTYRLHPELCRFISGAVYEDRLEAHEANAARTLVLDGSQPSWLRRAGLIYIPVEHDGNVYESAEEETRIAGLVNDLLRCELNDGNGRIKQVTRDDLLIVAPYNLQVNRLSRRLPGLRVGTIDKFQGQEAAVVILSMCSSTCDASPRGIEFLLSANRLNVALSRARTLAIIVASPTLIRTVTASIDNMRLMNMYCRAVWHAEAATTGPSTIG